ncbi:tryptophan-rich sensory protein [Deinococcus yavapaiensis]|uniref:TspO/MBR related protein n=1 Tax=Deinococcus yavapaiensis KR-236 TaxID=694435 RepID=A0A318SHH1_9DEIO|nr:tryptophan-rich sensory protein [Deinococcus yavapaiensis]PYE53378.1 TspO/MBR related protein [Deinococcus yavapaiensis KR-236]
MTGLSRQIILVVAVVVTLAMNTIAGIGLLFGRDPGSISDRLPNAFTPAGFTFSIWGLIFLALIAFAAWQARADQRGERLDKLAVPFLLANLFNITWLLAWHSLNYGLSVVIMLALLASLVWLYLRLDIMNLQGAEKFWLGAPISLYFGWISVATIANVTAWLVSRGVTDGLLGIGAQAWSAILIGVASLVGAFLLWRKRDWVFAVVLAWSFYGVYAARPNADVITAVILVGVASLLIAFFLGLRRLRTDPPRPLSA